MTIHVDTEGATIVTDDADRERSALTIPAGTPDREQLIYAYLGLGPDGLPIRPPSLWARATEPLRVGWQRITRFE